MCGAHRLDLAVRCLHLLQRAAAHQRLAIPSGHEGDVGRFERDGMQGMHASGRRVLVHCLEVQLEQGADLRVGEVAFGEDRSSRHGCSLADARNRCHTPLRMIWPTGC